MPWNSMMRRPALAALVDIGDGILEGGARDAERMRGDARPRLVERRRAAASGPVPGRAEQIGARHAAIPRRRAPRCAEARWPSLSSVRSTLKPGVPFSRTSAEIAPRPSAIPAHLPKTRMRSATSPLVMKVLPPLTTMSSPSGVKRVFMPVASEPASGSVMASAPSPPSAMRGSRRRFCSSLPKSISGFIA